MQLYFVLLDLESRFFLAISVARVEKSEAPYTNPIRFNMTLGSADPA